MISLEPPRTLQAEPDPWGALGLSKAGLTRFLHSAQRMAALDGNIDVLLTDDRELRRLNRQFRNMNKATDVLSFPAPAEVAHEHAGDLAISLETAARQAAEYGLTLRDEVRILLLHGVLHLQGMDHEIDDGEMAEHEAALRKQLRLPAGLIARAAKAPTIDGLSGKAKKSAKPLQFHTSQARSGGKP